MHGLDPDGDTFSPSDVQRVTQIFDKPKFFIDGAGANDIVQGAIKNCWFLSALSTLSTAEGLVEKSCVAVSHVHVLYRSYVTGKKRDEEVGVYGFIFFRDAAWTKVIIDEYVLLTHWSTTQKCELLYYQSAVRLNPEVRRTQKGREGAVS